MKKALLIFSFFAFASPMWATPPDSLRLDSVFRIDVRTHCVAMDAFKNLYVAKQNGALVQYDSLGKKKPYLYSNNRLGAPDALDVSNPLKAVLFYKNYQSLALLDRTLTETGVLDLNAAGIGWVSAFCLAQDGDFWVYDEMDFSLKKISQTGTLRYQGQNLNNLLQRPLIIEKMYVEAGRVYAWDTEFLYIFDNFGQYQKHIPLQGLDGLLALKNGFLAVYEQRVVQFDPFFLELYAWHFYEKNKALEEDLHSVFLKEKRLVRQSDKALTVFSW